jgi:hypothetical protein
MTSIRAVVHDRRIDVPAPDDLPDGTEVEIRLVPVRETIGLDESQWRDDPEALADWAAWLETIGPIPFAEPDAFDEQFRRYNVEAVRKQMFGEGT